MLFVVLLIRGQCCKYNKVVSVAESVAKKARLVLLNPKDDK